jgi:phospholipid/cholesterol/gamma-HCH transport system permease protein
MVAATHGSLSPRGKRSANAAPKGWEENLLSDGELRVRLFDEWVLASGTRSSTELSRRLSESPSPKKISFDSRELGAWDNVLINFLKKLEALAGERGIAVDRSGLPGGVQRLVGLARAVPERQGARRTQQRSDFLTRIGQGSLGFFCDDSRFCHVSR